MTTTQEKTAAKGQRRVFSAREKAQAVLAVWSGRRKPSAVCRSLGTTWGAVNAWEKNALSGILKGLGQEAPPAAVAGQSLGSRLEKLLAEPEQPELKGE